MTPALRLIATLLLAPTLSSLPAAAHDVAAGALQIIHPAIPAPAANARSAAGYMVLANEGSTPDRLIGVETVIAGAAMLHTTDFGADGVARMRHLPAIDLPAGGIVTLEPGGMHVMFMGLTAPLAEGDMVSATLVFEQAGRVAIEFMVDPADGTMDHSTMTH